MVSGVTARTFNTDDDLEVVAGGMFGNNQVILKGEVSVQAGTPYSFHGNTTSSEVSTIFFTGSTSQRTMFNDAGFKLNTTSGRVFTEGAPPDTQPSGTDGMPGGFDPNNNPDGGARRLIVGVQDICMPKQRQLKEMMLRNFLANTSGQLDIDQLLRNHRWWMRIMI